MGLKTSLQNRIARHLFSPGRRDAKRRKTEKQRRARNAPHIVEYFHQAGDPYSDLMAQILPDFVRRYEIALKVHIVAPPPDWAAPDRARLNAYARQDAERLAQRAGLQFSDPGEQPSEPDLQAASAALIAANEAGSFLQHSSGIGRQLWTGQIDASAPDDPVALAAKLNEAANDRNDKGHYLGATMFYGGEWYWGIDRLHYLESRLQALGAATDPSSTPIFAPPAVPDPGARSGRGPRPELHWYLSFRSPYTGIVADRIKALADAYGADLKLRYVLPMVMRGMQVPRMKGFYIMSDTVREAERLGIPFGNSCDPVGRPVERGYAILHKAIEQDKGFQFARSFLSGVWAEGIDAGTDRGLRIITERAGLSWDEMAPLLAQDHWRAVEDINQAEMFRYGVWGVPSFRVGDVTAWGQDRLWVIEDALKAHVEAGTEE